MLPADIEAAAHRHVPGAGPLDIRRLGGGLVNETYRVRRDGVDYALRVAASHQTDLGFDRAWEARALDRAARADLAPALVCCDPVGGILITRWVDGRLWSAEEARLQANIGRTAELLRRIHAVPLPVPARLMDPNQWIQYYAAAAGANAGFGRLEAAASARLEALALLPGVDPVLCHSDLHILNLLDRGDSLVLLDWEYAHAADPLWDLAGWSANNDFEDAQRSDLLACYAGRAPAPGERLRLQLLCWLYDYVCLLWCTVYSNGLGVSWGAEAPQGEVPNGTMPNGTMPSGIAARARQLAARLAARASSRAD
jgi:thiamine kinase-like enzyme